MAQTRVKLVVTISDISKATFKFPPAGGQAATSIRWPRMARGPKPRPGRAGPGPGGRAPARVVNL